MLVNYALTVLAGWVERRLARRGRSAGTPRSAAVPSDTIPTAEAASGSTR